MIKVAAIFRILKRHKIKLVFLLAAFGIWWFSLPDPLFDNPTATLAESRDGRMLGARIASDEQWRFPQADSVPYRFEKAIIYFEDEYFFLHPGFNPVSITKAFWNNISGKPRRGGSTISQQVIRLSGGNKKRTYFRKALELVQTLRLEAGFSKNEILGLYAAQAPFGGNVFGLETAAWRYFGVPASELSWGQTAALAVLPNAPSLIFPGKNEKVLKQKRDRLLLKLFQKKVIDQTTYELAIAEELPVKPFPLPDLTPHLTEKIKRENPGQRIKTTVDYDLQQKINRLAQEHHYLLSQNEVHNLAILVVDIATRNILAYVGNSPAGEAHHKYVDIIDKPRNTGSVLKPFLYASMLHSGEILPHSLVADIPTSVNGYAPENFDKEFHGAVPASTALARSLNIPAVRMLRDYGVPRFYNNLKKMKFAQINQPPEHYGLSMILGSAETSLWEVTRAYAGLASTLNFFNNSSGEYRKREFENFNYKVSAPSDFGETILSPAVFSAASVYSAFEAMQEVNRPEGEENWNFFADSRPVAWKTGTSYGFKDAWAVGITPEYAIGVWAGNASGEGRPELTGIRAAAPLFFDVLKTLPQTTWFQKPFDDMTEAEICKTSGYLAGASCGETRTEWIPVAGLRTETCPYHQLVFLNRAQTYRVNSSCYPLGEMIQKSWFVLPPVMEYYYRSFHPEYHVLPPFKNSCLQEGEKVMDFIYPKGNETILIPKDFDQQRKEVIFKLSHRNPETVLYWYLNSEFIGTTRYFHELAVIPAWGDHLLTVVDDQGNRLEQPISIRIP